MGILFFINFILIGFFIYGIVDAATENRKMLGRLLKVILIPTGILIYILINEWIEFDAPLFIGFLYYFGPIIITVILLIISYILGTN